MGVFSGSKFNLSPPPIRTSLGLPKKAGIYLRVCMVGLALSLSLYLASLFLLRYLPLSCTLSLSILRCLSYSLSCNLTLSHVLSHVLYSCSICLSPALSLSFTLLSLLFFFSIHSLSLHYYTSLHSPLPSPLFSLSLHSPSDSTTLLVHYSTTQAIT